MLKAAALITMALVTTGAAPPLQYGSSQGRPTFEDTPDSRLRGALLLRHIGSCVFGKERSAARYLLRTVPGSEDEWKWVESWRSRLEQCVNGDSNGLRFTGFVLRGAVAEGIFLAMYPADFVAAPAVVGSPDLPASWLAAYDKDPSLGPRLAMHQLAACVVRAAPVETSRLVRTTPGSPEESAAFGAISPHLGPCVNQGRSFSSDKTTLRALLAEALYDRFVGVDENPAPAH